MRPAAKLLSCLVKVVYCFVSIKFVHFQVANVLLENVKYLFCFVQVYVSLRHVQGKHFHYPAPCQSKIL